jgi:GT2 family glycosyltransferase
MLYEPGGRVRFLAGLHMPPIAVSIVNYRTADLVIASIPALLGELDGFEAALVVVVDNASGDGSAEALAQAIEANGWGARVRLVASERNGGFAAGNNLAFAEIARWEHVPLGVLLHNPDAQVRPGAVAALAQVLLDEPRAGAVGGCLERPDGEVWTAAFNFPSIASEIALSIGIGALARRFSVHVPPAEAPLRVDWVTGAAVLLRWRAVEQVGPMDEGYFLYYEEVDYMRALHSAGWQTWHTPEARVLHDAGQATNVVQSKAKEGRMPRYWFESWRRYYAKNHGALYMRATAASRLAALLLSYPLLALKGGRRRLPEHYLRDFARHCLFGPLPESHGHVGR